MASYKKPCRRCGAYLPSSSRFCPRCGSGAPFADLCPGCLHQVSREERRCGCCGRALRAICPVCGGETFVGEACERCGASLMKRCPNPRCGELQFFENMVCTACGGKF
jgi:hypothetical protein